MSVKSDDIAGDHPVLLEDIVLHEDDLTEEAKNRFGFHTKIFDAFQRNRRHILENDQLSPLGRHIILSRFEKAHTNGKRILNYAATNSEVINTSLPSFGPLVICGLPRTGSTLLYNLLACDPNCRAPLFIDMNVECVPPIPRSDVDERERRLLKAKQILEKRDQLMDEHNKYSHSHPDLLIEEDYLIFDHAGLLPVTPLTSSLDQPECGTWFYDKMDKDFVYAYHETFLRVMNSVDKPNSHWLLKTPFHNLYFNTLLEQYPNAAIIMTHRNIDEVVPSFCRLGSTFGFYFDQNKPTGQKILKTRFFQAVEKFMESIVEFRTSKNDKYDQVRKNIVDVMYEDLMKDPVAIARQIYNHFNLRWSHEFETAMCDWLRNNPQGKQGRNTYSLSDFDLTHEDIAKRFGPYIDLFFRPSSSF